MKSPAEVAHEAYAGATRVSGPLPTLESLTLAERRAWEDVATAVIGRFGYSALRPLYEADEAAGIYE